MKSILIGHSLIAGLHHYCKIWNNFLKPIGALKCGMGGDKVQNVLWWVQNLLISSFLKNVILCGTNNLQQDSPEDIVDGIIEIGTIIDTITLIFLFAVTASWWIYLYKSCLYHRNQQNIKSNMLVEQVPFYWSRYLLD